MQELKDEKENPLVTDKQKVEGLENRHFCEDKSRRQLEDIAVEQRGVDLEIRELEGERVRSNYLIDELKSKLRKALQGTSNTLVPGLDRISYHFIKAFKQIVFGDEL